MLLTSSLYEIILKYLANFTPLVLNHCASGITNMQALFVNAVNLVRFGSLMGTRH